MLTTDYLGQVNDLHDDWKKAFDWKEGTGNGAGQRQIDDAPAGTREDVEQEVMGECVVTMWSDLSREGLPTMSRMGLAQSHLH
jgi:hypothetical protein